ncbi:hypothetical protein [Sphingomonas phyllosphaerae]|uniref:hypothetical protein n=1 Tax=Sphingomonas phyllosphaerae TaxID=257003 RepID=UPI002413A011|nr:hypothetical protein [Sphingomonas phyllosphaerae]
MPEPARVVRSIAIGSGRRVVLYAPAAGDDARARNLVCLDRAGRVVWRGELPPATGPDRFVAVERDGDSLQVETLSGRRLLISPGTGRGLG